MISLKDIELYLPKYLSPEIEEKLFQDLIRFPDNIDDRIYTSYGIDPNIIFQGDGLKDLLVINLPDTTIKKVPSMVLSNTCDIDPENKRKFQSNIIYSPIMRLEAYRKRLLDNGMYGPESIESHLDTIRKQKITQIFYLPIGRQLKYEAMIFFDRLVSCDNESIDRENLEDKRLFTLSQYGHYLFLYKLSIHFTRIMEGIERKY